MIDIIFTACTIATQFHTCIDRKIPVEAEVRELHMCEKNAQFELSKWAVENPGWWITRFKCVDASKKEVDA